MFEPTAVEVVIYSTVEDNSLIHERIALDASASDYLQAVEDVMYANPLLVNGMFDRVCCLSCTAHYAMIPADTDEELTQKIAGELFGNEALTYELLTDNTGDNRQDMLFAMDKPLASFLRRTFTNPDIHHRLYPLLRYFNVRSRLGNTGKMFVHFTGTLADIIVYGHDTPVYVNSFRYRDPMDAVYYIMAARRLCGLSEQTDGLVLAGDAGTRKAVMPLLRQYIATVMPAIFPSALFRAGKEALTSPFNMAVLPLCE